MAKLWTFPVKINLALLTLNVQAQSLMSHQRMLAAIQALPRDCECSKKTKTKSWVLWPGSRPNGPLRGQMVWFYSLYMYIQRTQHWTYSVWSRALSSLLAILNSIYFRCFLSAAAKKVWFNSLCPNDDQNQICCYINVWSGHKNTGIIYSFDVYTFPKYHHNKHLNMLVDIGN